MFQKIIRKGMFKRIEKIGIKIVKGIIKKKAELSKLNFDESFKLKCWLLDEPLNHLDENGKLFLKNIMDKFINMNGTILQTSHEKKVNYKNFKLIKL